MAHLQILSLANIYFFVFIPTMSISSQPKMSGGSDQLGASSAYGAASYGEAIYGSPGAQHAGASGSIATNSPDSYRSNGGRKRARRSGGRHARRSARRSGGRHAKRSARRRRNGGTTLIDIAVPAGLYAAKRYMANRRRTYRN